jgi:glycosyltransferase involved in cell wall biosynthesis
MLLTLYVFKHKLVKNIGGKRIMNILFVFYVPSGGVETLNRQRSAALRKYNINAHFLYYENRRNYINNHDAPTFITNKDEEVKRILEKVNYSAIVIVSDFNALSRFKSLGFKGKMIIEIQGYGPKHAARTAFVKAIPQVNAYADGFLNPKTPHIVQLLDEIFPKIPKFSFNNCFDTAQFTYRKTIPSPLPIVAWVGRIEDNKNWSEFLQIGSKLIKDHNPNIQLHLFEDPTLSTPNERNKFRELVKQLNLQSNIKQHFNIPNSQMAEHFSRIGDSGGFLCSTSKVEGAPYSLLEAMSCKCPVLTTDSDGVRSSIIHNKTGKYYTLGDVNEAVKEAKELMTNHLLRDFIRENAFEHISTNFSPEKYAKNFINMLSSLGIYQK